MRRILIITLCACFGFVALVGCGGTEKKSETVAVTLGGSSPEDAFRKYTDYINGGSYKEAFGILTAASRQGFDRAAVDLFQLRTNIESVPDPQEKLYLQQILSKLKGNTGEDLFIALMSASLPPEGTQTATLGAVTMNGDSFAEATNSNGIKFGFVKETDGLWRIELPKAGIDTGLSALELRLNAIKSGKPMPVVTAPEVAPATPAAPGTIAPAGTTTNPVAAPKPEEKK